MQINWTKGAEADLDRIYDYISQDNCDAAVDVILYILNSVEQLLPGTTAIGRAGRILGTRELVITKYPYIVPYRVRGDCIDILRVLHSAMKWPEKF